MSKPLWTHDGPCRIDRREMDAMISAVWLHAMDCVIDLNPETALSLPPSPRLQWDREKQQLELVP